jgi:hypothetical protein
MFLLQKGSVRKAFVENVIFSFPVPAVGEFFEVFVNATLQLVDALDTEI